MSERAEFRNSDSPDHSAGHQPILKDDDDNSSTSDLDLSIKIIIKSEPNYNDTLSEGMDHDSGDGVTDPSNAAATNPTAPPADTLVDGVPESSSVAATNPTSPPADTLVDGVPEPSSASAAPNAYIMNSDPSPEAGDKDGRNAAGATSSIIKKQQRSRSKCVVYGCRNTPAKNPKLSFHGFPKKEKAPERHAKWLEAVMRQDWKPSAWSFVCSEHFSPESYSRQPGLATRVMLRRNATPTIFRFIPKYLQPKLPKPPSNAGRPKQPPQSYIAKLQRKVKYLQQKVRRLDKKARDQTNLLRLLQKDNKIQQEQLESIGLRIN